MHNGYSIIDVYKASGQPDSTQQISLLGKAFDRITNKALAESSHGYKITEACLLFIVVDKKLINGNVITECQPGRNPPQLSWLAKRYSAEMYK